MNKLSSRSLDLRYMTSVEAVRKVTADLLTEAARFIAGNETEVPGAIVFHVKRERHDIWVEAELKPFDPAENLL